MHRKSYKVVDQETVGPSGYFEYTVAIIMVIRPHVGVDITDDFHLTKGQSFECCRLERSEEFVPETDSTSELQKKAIGVEGNHTQR